MLSDISSGRQIFLGRLAADEDVLWYGQPKPSVLFDANDIFLVPFSLLCGGFALFWEGSVVAALLRGETKSGNGGDLLEFAIAGVVAVLVGLYLIIGRFFGKRWLKRRTHYLITNKRAISLVDIKGGRVLSLDLGRLKALSKSVGRDGVGTIRLETRSPWSSSQDNTGLELVAYLSRRQKPPPVFYDVDDADRVYDLIEETRREKATPNGTYR